MQRGDRRRTALPSKAVSREERSGEPPRFTLAATPATTAREGFADAVRGGLGTDPKSLPCRFFYDARGSLLFERITELPEYYPTRAERSILRENAAEIARSTKPPVELVELGSGSASKTRLLIESLIEANGSLVFRPIDISRTILEQSSKALLDAHPELRIEGLVGEYEAGLRALAADGDPQRSRLVLWLGSSIGNLSRESAARFLGLVRRALRASDRMLVGIDLRKDRETLELAYDDPAGVTAAFNLNLLVRINRELGGHFDLEAFAHEAVYVEDAGRVEIHLVSRREQRVAIDALACEVELAAGERIHTENSYKYSEAEIDAVVREAGLVVRERWLDRDRLFSLNLLAPAEAGSRS